MDTTENETTPARRHPWMWADYTELPLKSLSFDMVDTRIVAPYCVTLRFFARGRYLHAGRQDHGDALVGRHILPADVLIFDRTRTTPEHDAIVLVRDGDAWVPRVCAVLGGGGWSSAHARGGAGNDRCLA